MRPNVVASGDQDVKSVYNDASLVISKAIERRYSNSLTESNFEEIAQLTGLNQPPNKSILDIGCGNGNAAIWFAKSYPVKISAIDISPTMLSQAKASVEREGLSERISVSEMDFNSVASSEVYDVVFAIDVAMYFEDKEKLYGKLRQFLKPRGWVVTTDYASEGKTPEVFEELKKRWALAHPPNFHVLSDSIRHVGLTPTRLENASLWQINHWKEIQRRVEQKKSDILKLVSDTDYENYMRSAQMIVRSLEFHAHQYVFCIAQKA